MLELSFFSSIGSSWGCNDIGQTDCCFGCGTDQEEFYNCADVSITDGTGSDDQTFEQQPDEQLTFERYISLFEETFFLSTNLFQIYWSSDTFSDHLYPGSLLVHFSLKHG